MAQGYLHEKIKIKESQIKNYLKPKKIVTGLNIGAPGDVGTYKDDLLSANFIIFFLSNSGTNYGQALYFPTASHNFSFYVGSYSYVSSNNRMRGLYFRVPLSGSSSGHIITSDFDYDGTTKITGFAVF